MNLITKTISLPKVGKTRITFFRDKKRSTKDKSTFSLPFDVEINDKIVTGEIIYNPEMRTCRVFWNENPDNQSAAQEVENFIKEFLFGSLMATTEPIESDEAEKIIAEFHEFYKFSINTSIDLDGALIISFPIVGRESKIINIILRKKDTGDYYLTDDGYILRSFRPHERGQRERVVFSAKRLGIQVREEELYLDSSPEELAENLYKFIQMTSAVYIFYLF